MIATIDWTSIILAVITCLGGCGWEIDRKKHRQEIESLKAYGLQEDGTPTVSGKLSAVSKVLKWMFWILIGLIGLVITAKVCLQKR